MYTELQTSVMFERYIYDRVVRERSLSEQEIRVRIAPQLISQEVDFLMLSADPSMWHLWNMPEKPHHGWTQAV